MGLYLPLYLPLAGLTVLWLLAALKIARDLQRHSRRTLPRVPAAWVAQFLFIVTRDYFQHRPFLLWLLSVTITFNMMVSIGLLLHEKNWPLLMGWSFGIPTATAVINAVTRR